MKNYLRYPEVRDRTGRSRSSIWRDIRGGRFPAPRQIGPNAIAWLEEEIEAWCNSRPVVNYITRIGRDQHGC